MGGQTIFLLIFLALFLTFLILYVTSTGCSSSVVKLVPPAAASLGTNKKPLSALKFSAPENLSQLEVTVSSNFTVSRYHYGPPDKKPFLTIVTRTCAGREALLQRNIEKCAQMIDQDFEHVILTDHKMSGMLIAETALYVFRNEYQGEYICHLDDDDYCCNSAFVTVMKRLAKAGFGVIISKAWSVDQNRELPCVWEKFPLEGEICTSNVLVKKDIYLANISAIAQSWAGDYAFIHNVLIDAKDRTTWVDQLFFYIDKNPTLQSRKEYVTVDLQGGLGNQMFQVATAYAYARKHNKTLVFDHSVAVISPNADVPRKSYFSTMFRDTEHFDVKGLYWNEYVEPEFSYQKIPHFHGHVRLKGYFQSAKYFEAYRNEILNLFQPVQPQETVQPNDPVPREIDESLIPSVSLHVRRTDYVTHADFHTNQSMTYYTAAVKYLDMEKLQIHVFSDDLKWCQDNLPGYFPEHDLVFVSGSDIEDLKNMSQCDHHILANSSFSWWGSYLDTKETSITVAPKIWFNDEKLKWQDIYCEKWIVM